MHRLVLNDLVVWAGRGCCCMDRIRAIQGLGLKDHQMRSLMYSQADERTGKPGCPAVANTQIQSGTDSGFYFLCMLKDALLISCFSQIVQKHQKAVPF